MLVLVLCVTYQVHSVNPCKCWDATAAVETCFVVIMSSQREVLQRRSSGAAVGRSDRTARVFRPLRSRWGLRFARWGCIALLVPDLLRLLCAMAVVVGGLWMHAGLFLIVHEGLLVRSSHCADDLLLPAVSGAGGVWAGAGVHGAQQLGVRAGFGPVAQGGVGGRARATVLWSCIAGWWLAAVAVVHHVVHGVLHLEQHALLLSFGNPAETHSWGAQTRSAHRLQQTDTSAEIYLSLCVCVILYMYLAQMFMQGNRLYLSFLGSRTL